MAEIVLSCFKVLRVEQRISEISDRFTTDVMITY